MGTSKSGAELAKKLFNAGHSVERATEMGLKAGGQLVKITALAQLAAAGAGSGRMSGVGKNGAPIGVGYDILKASNGEAAVRVKVKGKGAHLLERDTKAHTINPKKRRGGAKGGKGAVRLADGSFRRSVRHPGTRGKHPWEKALNQSLPQVPKTIQQQISSALAKAFAG